MSLWRATILQLNATKWFSPLAHLTFKPFSWRILANIQLYSWKILKSVKSEQFWIICIKERSMWHKRSCQVCVFLFYLFFQITCSLCNRHRKNIVLREISYCYLNNCEKKFFFLYHIMFAFLKIVELLVDNWPHQLGNKFTKK